MTKLMGIFLLLVFIQSLESRSTHLGLVDGEGNYQVANDENWRVVA